MTTGSVTTGSTVGPSYYKRIWSGTNGKYITGSTRLNWNAYSLTVIRATQTKGQGVSGSYMGTLETAPAPSDNLVLEALNKLQENVRGHSFDAAVFAGEFPKTVQLVENTLYRLVQGVRYVRRGRIDLALRLFGAKPQRRHRRNYREASTPLDNKAVSSLWLEIQYGWRPLINDCYEATKAYSAIADKPRKTRVKGAATTTYDWKQYLNGGIIAYHRANISVKYTVELREQITTARSLGLCDPTSVAWELVPFSFVADWFIPIGTYIENLAQIPKISGRYMRSDVTTNKVVCDGLCTGSLASYYCGAKLREINFRISRTVPSSLVIPRPQFVGFEEGISAGKRIFNAIALLHQVFIK